MNRIDAPSDQVIDGPSGQVRDNRACAGLSAPTRAADAEMRPKGFLIGVIVLAAALLCGNAAQAERRVAFVIGNSAYKNATSLPNTINDSNAVAALFRSVGFEVVTSRTDLGVLDFKRAVRDFLITAETADIAVVYYAGHGIEVSGTNYLIPVDAKLARDYDVEDEAVALDRIIWALQSVKRLRLILLDACRDNPFVTKLQRSVGVRAAAKGGLGKIDDVSADTLVAYAAKAGSVSYDGDGANSPFATALLKHIAEPGIDIRIALGRVRDEVLKLTAGRQEPFIYGSLGGATIPLVPPPAKKLEPAPVPPPAVAAREPATRPAAAIAPAEPNRVDKPAPTIANAPPAKAEPAKASPKSQAVLEPPLKPQAAVDPAAACGRDELRLARLRSDPVPDEVSRLQRELSCDKLRPQVQRLFESIAVAPLASPAAAGGTGPTTANAPPAKAEPAKPPPAKSQAALEPPPKPQAAPRPEDPALACSRDELRLARLRSDPVPDEVARLQRELSCDKLRPQVQRLFESIPTVPPASQAPVAAVSTLNAVRRSGPPVEPAAGTRTRAAPISQENACARDTERLARVRADPTPDAIARFEKELGCEHIRPQLQRLQESVGQ
jgi:hypothetical protein